MPKSIDWGPPIFLFFSFLFPSDWELDVRVLECVRAPRSVKGISERSRFFSFFFFLFCFLFFRFVPRSSLSSLARESCWVCSGATWLKDPLWWLEMCWILFETRSTSHHRREPQSNYNYRHKTNNNNKFCLVVAVVVVVAPKQKGNRRATVAKFKREAEF